MLGSNWERFGYDSRLTLDTLMASMKPTAVQSPRYASGQIEHKSVSTSKTQLLGVGDRDLQPTTELLDKNGNRKPAGYPVIFQVLTAFLISTRDIFSSCNKVAISEVVAVPVKPCINVQISPPTVGCF